MSRHCDLLSTCSSFLTCLNPGCSAPASLKSSCRSEQAENHSQHSRYHEGQANFVSTFVRRPERCPQNLHGFSARFFCSFAVGIPLPRAARARLGSFATLNLIIACRKPGPTKPANQGSSSGSGLAWCSPSNARSHPSGGNDSRPERLQPKGSAMVPIPLEKISQQLGDLTSSQLVSKPSSGFVVQELNLEALGSSCDVWRGCSAQQDTSFLVELPDCTGKAVVGHSCRTSFCCILPTPRIVPCFLRSFKQPSTQEMMGPIWWGLVNFSSEAKLATPIFLAPKQPARCDETHGLPPDIRDSKHLTALSPQPKIRLTPNAPLGKSPTNSFLLLLRHLMSLMRPFTPTETAAWLRRAGQHGPSTKRAWRSESEKGATSQAPLREQSFGSMRYGCECCGFGASLCTST